MNNKTLFTAFIAILFLGACTGTTTRQDQTVEVTPDATVEVEFKDFGPEPFVFDIEAYTTQNETYRTSIWTGEYMQMTVMSIPAGEDIGLEMHLDIDQFLRVEAGTGIMRMGDNEDNLDFEARVEHDFAVFIPAGKWHNLVNDSDEPLKIYSIYAPSEHPRSTVHQTQAEGIEAHEAAHGH
jgi:mannose-6-phosphate isomerase-like protein (cupin superfamily)